MQVKLIDLETGDDGSYELPDEIFGLTPRGDILHRVVRWQRARRQQGTHKAKTRSEGSYSGRKIWRQKKTGQARHGDRNAPLFRKGGVYAGPVPRSHAHKLPKRIRRLGLKHALSDKAREKRLHVLNKATSDTPKTAYLNKLLRRRGIHSALIIDGDAVDENFARASRNLPNMHILPAAGANVYDIMRSRRLLITKRGVECLAERLK
ncbi:MAG: 50S ribosomal protein L4 [Rhodobacteraceae bacterium]|nr:50S ribosomal protein L4 [Paracoccaceae bacterium]